MAFWKTTELQVLREEFPKGGTRLVMTRLPHRNENAIKAKASLLGLVRKDTPPEWTTTELQTLRAAYAVGGMQAAREMLPHRTPCAIHSAASRHGIKSVVKRVDRAKLAALVQDAGRKPSISALAAQLGVSRTAIRNYLKAGAKHGYEVHHQSA